MEVKAPLQREWGERAVGRKKEEKGDTSRQRWGRVAGQEKRSPDMNSPIQGAQAEEKSMQIVCQFHSCSSLKYLPKKSKLGVYIREKKPAYLQDGICHKHADSWVRGQENKQLVVLSEYTTPFI